MRRTALATAAFVLAIAACGGSRPPRAAAPAPTGPLVLRDDQLRRSEVMSTLSAGLGQFLGRVEVEPKLTAGKFEGWRVLAFHDGDGRWGNVEIRPGDVVTAVNGYPIERPEQAQVAWSSVALSKSLRVAYVREGQAREQVWEIVDDGDQPVVAASASARPLPPPAAAPSASAAPPR